MKITFPHMGTTLIFAKLFELFDHEIIMPPRPSKKTIDLGVKHSPEFACFPFKVIMGSYLEAIEAGADTIVTSGGHGPCRAGYYGELHKKILDDFGHQVNFIIFNAPQDNWSKFMENLKKIKAKKSWFNFWRNLKIIYKLAKAIDNVEKIVEQKRAYSPNGEVDLIWKKAKEEFNKINTIDEIEFVETKVKADLDSLSIHLPADKDRIKIGIIGEIYVVMEESINNYIEEKLNSFGVEVERSHYLSDWIDDTFLPFFGESTKIKAKGQQYIKIGIGGHAQESVGRIVDYKDRGFHGVIHLKPFGCLPELVSQSMLDKIAKDLNIPILSISIDEQIAEANILTRVEAFLDMVRQQKSLEERKIKHG